MTAIKKLLGQATVNAGFGASLYVAPAGYTTVLKEVTVCNPSLVDVLFTLGIRSGTASLGNAIYYKAYIQAGQTAIISLSSVVPTGYTVYTSVNAVTTGGSLNVIASGVDIANSSAKQLVVNLLDTVGATALYTVPTGKTSVLYQALFTNGSSSSATVTMYVVPPAGSKGTTNQVLQAIEVDPGVTLMYSASTGMAAGSTIYALSSVASAINLTIDGTEK